MSCAGRRLRGCLGVHLRRWRICLRSRRESRLQRRALRQCGQALVCHDEPAIRIQPALLRLLPAPRHQALMTRHAEYALRCPCIAQVLNLAFTVAALEAIRTEGLITRQDGQVLNLVAARTAAVCAVVADEGAITKQKEIRIGVEEGLAGVAPKAVYVPAVAS